MVNRGGFSLAGLLAVPVILFLLAQLLAAQYEQGRLLREAVNSSYETRVQLQSMLSLHQDVETGQRGYVLTRDRSFLEPNIEARRQLPNALAALRSKARASPRFSRSLELLEQESAAKLAYSQRTVELVRVGRSAQVARIIASGRGQVLMNRVRARIRSLDAYEQQQLTKRIAAADAARTVQQRTTYALQTLLVLLLALSAWLASRSMAVRNRALREAREQNARQEAIFDAAMDGMIILHNDGEIEAINPAVARMYGYSPSDLVGRRIDQLFEVPPEPGAIERFLKGLQKRRRGEAGRMQEFSARRASGTIFATDVAVSPVELPDGLRYLAVVRDVTERKQIEQMKTEFVSTVSHELRTPLTSISGSLGLLAGGAAGELSVQARRLVTIARSNCDRLVRLINDILDIEKIEAGQLRFDMQTVRLRSLLDQAVEANRAFADEHGVHLVIEPGGEEAEVLVDPDRLMQVLTNLLSNAAKFSPKGETVLISIERKHRRWRVTVADRGAGIPEEFKSRIFGKFAQADSTDMRAKGGTGLGLAIVREIVTRMSGEVSFETSSAVGTRFHVDLPAADPAPPAADERRAVARPEPADQPRILHVDDDPDVLRIVAGAFEGTALLLSSPSVQEAKAALAREAFDLIILDIAMADGSGLELLPLIEMQEARTPVVIFSAQDADRALAERVEAALTKSRASMEQLVEAVVSILERRA